MPFAWWFQKSDHNNEPDYLPSVMDDGRGIYTRWEYTDKPLWRAQGLWTVNPDGTQVNTFSGSVGIIDPDQGLNFPDGLTKATADVEWPESGNGPSDPVESPRYHCSGNNLAKSDQSAAGTMSRSTSVPARSSARRSNRSPTTSSSPHCSARWRRTSLALPTTRMSMLRSRTSSPRRSTALDTAWSR
jgi:hypothetical protein